MSVPHGRKLRLTPLEGALLFLLEEAGSENIVCLVNSLQPEVKTSPEALLRAACDAIQHLLDMGLVSLDLRGSQAPIDCTKISAVMDFLRFDDRSGYWCWDEVRGGKAYPEIVLEAKGKQALAT